LPFQQDNLLEVGIALSAEASQSVDWNSAVAAAAESVLASRKDRDLALRALLLLATPDWCDPERPLSALFRSKFREELGYAVSLIGASVPRAFVSLPPSDTTEEPRSVEIRNGFVLVALFSNDLWMTVDSVREPERFPDEDTRKRAVKKMAERIKQSAREKHLGLGTSAASDLFAIFPGPIRKADRSLTSLDMELHDQVTEAFEDSKAVFGGSAANQLDAPEGGFQFQDDVCLPSSLAVALIEYDFKMGGAMAHGLRAIRDLRLIITALGNPNEPRDYVVAELDGQPAADRLREVCRDVGMLRRRPTLGFGVGPYSRIVTPVDYSPESHGPLRLTRKVTLGFPLTMMDATTTELLDFAKIAQGDSITRSSANQAAVRLILGFVCIGRYREYEREGEIGWHEAAKRMAPNCAARVPIVYAVMAGEFGETRRRRPRADNFNASFVCLTGEPNNRSFNRLLQAKLLKSAESIGACGSVRDVMREAIDLALKAGASEGQICVCDRASWKILGAPYGHASPGLAGVGSKTRRDLHKEGDVFTLNEKLKHWSMAVGARPTLLRSIKPTSRTDILSIVAANRLAVFIPDSEDPDFFCDQESVKEAHTEAQLIMPLVGSKGTAVATLQLMFPDDSHVNREMMRSWIAYGQQVAAILERAVESEARELFDTLDRQATEIMGRQAPEHPFPEAEIEEFLSLLRCLLDVDYLHLRIREEVPDAEPRYRLVAPGSDLAREHKRLRPYLGPNEGSLAHVWRQESGPSYAETAQETREQYDKYQRDRGDLTPEGRWRLGDKVFEAFYVCRLGDRPEPDGCLVLHSTKPFFFTQWRIDLVQQSAQQLMMLIRKRKADYQDKERQLLKDEIAALGLLWAETGHDIGNLLGSIRWNVDLLRTNLGTPEAAEKYFANISQRVDRAVDLLRKHAGQVPLGNAPVRLRTLLEAARQAMVAPWEGVPEFKGQSEAAYVKANFWVPKALANLLTNAVEHAADRPDGCVWVTVGRPSGSTDIVRIEIGNDGNLIGKEEIEQLRKLGESGKGGSKHLGMGIPLAELGIATVGGDIAFLPRPEGGLVVTVDLPLIQSVTSST
jgi:signal transduction histidine kinase